MELTNAFGQPFLTITYDPAHRWLHNQWQGMLSVGSVMQGATAVLEWMREHDCGYLLNDNLRVVGSWNQANDWIAQTWMPQALTLGLRRFAHVAPPGTFVATSAEEMHRRAADQFAMAIFPALTDAKAWLRAAQAGAPPSIPSLG